MSSTDDRAAGSIDTSLADALFAGSDTRSPRASTAEPDAGTGSSPELEETAVRPAAAAEDDEDYFAPPQKRSRVTIALVVALIFLVGLLAGVSLARLLPSTTAPQVVYVLGDSGAAGPAAPPSSMAATPR